MRIIELNTNRNLVEDSPLTPELKEFIDRAIVPILIEHYLEDQGATDDLADGNALVDGT